MTNSLLHDTFASEINPNTIKQFIIMNGSIYSLIQEKRKLFYTGVIRNSYKTPMHHNEEQEYNNSSSNQQEKSYTIKSRGIQMLQEIFSE